MKKHNGRAQARGEKDETTKLRLVATVSGNGKTLDSILKLVGKHSEVFSVEKMPLRTMKHKLALGEIYQDEDGVAFEVKRVSSEFILLEGEECFAAIAVEQFLADIEAEAWTLKTIEEEYSSDYPIQ